VTQTHEVDGLSVLKATIDDDPNEVRNEATVEAGNAVRFESLFIDIKETGELALAAGLEGLEISRKTRTSIVERVDEERARSTGRSATSYVT
jgi:hypothetical protein